MNFIAFETSSSNLSIALSYAGQIYSRDIADSAHRNAELALPLLHALLAEAKMALTEVDVVAYGKGPGAFTGVRIACGLAQGLAYGLGRPVIGLTSLALLAWQARHQETDYVMAAVDARMGETYVAIYKKNAGSPAAPSAVSLTDVALPQLTSPAGVNALMTQLNGQENNNDRVFFNSSFCAIGSAFDVPELADGIQAALAKNGVVLNNVITHAHPRAADLIAMAAELIAAEAFDGSGASSLLTAPHLAAPLYLRNNVAMTIAEREILNANKNLKSQPLAQINIANIH